MADQRTMKGRSTMARTAALLAAASLIATVFVCGLSGCGKQSDGLSTEQRQSGDRLSEIAKKTGGDWAKLTEGDRDFLIKMSYGNEQSAKWLLLGAAGKVGGGSGPQGGKKFGPPGGAPGQTPR